MPKKKLLVFTGGGIAPALNPTIVGVVRMARTAGFQVFGGRQGWGCLLPESPDGFIDLTALHDTTLDLIASTGGSYLGSARVNPFHEDSPTDLMLAQASQFDGIVAIGGDDTLGAAAQAADRGIPIVGIPKTIDNDLSVTYVTPGFPTAADVIARMTKAITIAAAARGKIHLIETLGGKAGWLTAAAAIGGADIVVPPEWPVELETLLDRIITVYRTQGHAVVALSHYAELGISGTYSGAPDSYGLSRPYLVSLPLRERLAERLTRVEIKVEIPGNVPSGADPIELDQRVARELANEAILNISYGRFGLMSTVTSSLGASSCSLTDATGAYRSLTTREYDPTSMRVTAAYHAYLQTLIGRDHEPYLLLLR